MKRHQRDLRQAEMEEAVAVLQAINDGDGAGVRERNARREGDTLSGWRGRLDMDLLVVGGHSYGATGAVSVARPLLERERICGADACCVCCAAADARGRAQAGLSGARRRAARSVRSLFAFPRFTCPGERASERREVVDRHQEDASLTYLSSAQWQGVRSA